MTFPKIDNDLRELVIMLLLVYTMDEHELNLLSDESNVVETTINYMQQALGRQNRMSSTKGFGMNLWELADGLTMMTLIKTNRSKIAHTEGALAALVNMLCYENVEENTSAVRCRGVFDVDDKREILKHTSRKKRTETMLQKLLNAGSGSAFAKFIEVLELDHKRVVEELRKDIRKELQELPTMKKETPGHIPTYNDPIRLSASASASESENLDDLKKGVAGNFEKLKDEEELMVSKVKMCKDMTLQLKKHWEDLSDVTGSKLNIEMHPCKLERWMKLKVTSDIPVMFIDNDNTFPWISEAAHEKNDVVIETVTLVVMMSNHLKIIRENLPNEELFQKILKELDEFHQKSEYIISWCKSWNKFTEIFETFMKHLSNIVMPSISNFSDQMRLLFSDKLICFTITDSEILGSIMGFVSSFSSGLHKLGEFDLGHENPIYYFKRWIEMNWDKDCKNRRNDYFNGDNLKQILMALGFTTERSNTIVDSMEEYFITSQTGLFWALRYVDMMFASHPLLSSFSREPPYESQTVNEWFKQRIRRDRTDDAIKECDIEMINFNSNDTNKVLQKIDKIKKMAERNQHELWFHGTPLFEYVDSILQEGILLRKGTKYKDFSKRDGFYLSDDFETAYRWAKNSLGNNYAVLVFSVPQEGLTENFLDLKNDITLWKKVVRSNRSDYSKEGDLKNGIRMSRNPGVAVDDLESEFDCVVKLKDFDMIRGPICLNVQAIINDSSAEAPCLARDQSGREVQQMCVRGKKLAKAVGTLTNIPAVFWFPC